MPPPFFQGIAVKEDLRMICSLEFCTPVFNSVPLDLLRFAQASSPLTHEINP
jgi:hypothetical protein